jgi:hypothetical protein
LVIDNIDAARKEVTSRDKESSAISAHARDMNEDTFEDEDAAVYRRAK